VRLLVDWMAAHGYERAFVDDAGNAVGIIGSGARQVVLLGHIDTFPGVVPVRIEGRTLYGRGSVDAKGSLCTFAVAGAQAQLAQDLTLIVIGAVEEEARSSKGAHFAATQYQPEACVIGEPSHWDRITLGYKGRLLLTWEWQGALAHSASTVSSPPEHAFAYWERVREYVTRFNQGREGVFAQLDVTLQEINSGQQGAFGWSRMVIGFRLPPQADPHAIAADLSSDLDGATITASGHEVAVLAEKDHALSRAMRGAIRGQSGTPRFVTKTGTSDMNVVAPRWGCPILAYGPGDSAYDHTPDEQIDLDEYLRAIAVLTDALAKL
jgi:LysW-gamma-L-lysine carboxypeptidase